MAAPREITDLVERFDRNRDSSLTGTDRQIDELVYELYGLTEEEIRIVEGNGA